MTGRRTRWSHLWPDIGSDRQWDRFARYPGVNRSRRPDAPPEEMLQALRTVHAGDAVIAPSTTRRLLEHLVPATDPVAAQAVAGLTEREREVLVAMARGWSNGEIAERFVLADGTVKTHVGRILAKLGVRDRVQAVVLAFDAGLVRPGGQ